MWTFRTIGETEDPTGFEATFDGPVEDTEAALGELSKRATELVPTARTLCQGMLTQTIAYVRGVENGKRRFSMNLSGGLGVQRAWSLRLELNLAEDPQA